MDDVAIRVSGVSKSFKLPHEKQGSVKNAFINVFRGKRTYEKQEVLKDISFDIKKGEFFGIVGRNGSGKSTLLKLMAGIYAPSKGHIHVEGKLTPFIELGVGFNPELTGRENIFLNGALLGFSRSEMEKMYKEIVEFAELEKFMDQKLKNYSSGMQVRLAFSIAIRAKSDILVLDEVLAVGDANFQQKCYDYFGELSKSGTTVVFVSHDLESIRRFCDRSVLLSEGKIQAIGKTSKILKKYSDVVKKYTTISVDSKSRRKRLPKQIKIVEMNVKNLNDTIDEIFAPEETICIEITIKAEKTTPNPVVGFQVVDSSGKIIVASNTFMQNINLGTLNKGMLSKISFSFPNYLTDGTYKVSCAVNKEHAGLSYDRLDEYKSLVVTGFDFKYSKLHPPIKTEVKLNDND